MERSRVYLVLILLALALSPSWGQDAPEQKPSSFKFINPLRTVEIIMVEGESTWYLLSPVEMPTEENLASPMMADSTIKMKDILEELQFTDSQRANLNERMEKLRSEHQNNLDKLSQGESSIEIEKLNDQYISDVQNMWEDILLPFQEERLTQVHLQTILSSWGSVGVESNAFSDVLKLTQEQLAELHQKAEVAEEKLRREIQALRRLRHREVIEDVLTREQLQALDTQLGPPISMGPPK